jgi:hypothetical protein
MDGFAITVDSAGAYVIDTSEVVAGPPLGTATFDNRAPGEIPHCSG